MLGSSGGSDEIPLNLAQYEKHYKEQQIKYLQKKSCQIRLRIRSSLICFSECVPA